jgi:hypothetical protein
MNVPPSRLCNGGQLISHMSSSSQREGAFVLVVGTHSSVEDHMNTLKKQHDPYGQLSLSANVVESTNNYEYVLSEDKDMNRLLNYIDFDNKTRNGMLGEDAAFVYPLKQPSVASSSKTPSAHYEIGIYADGKDLDTFLNFVGEDSWNNVVKRSPDRITDFALQFVEAHPVDANGTPIHIQQLDPPPRQQTSSMEASSVESNISAGFLNFFA